MNSHLADALLELEQSTENLLEADVSDITAVCRALERRAEAITKVASLAQQFPAETALARLRSALARGDEATRAVLSRKEDAMVEWARCNRILQGLRSAQPEEQREVDCSG